MKITHCGLTYSLTPRRIARTDAPGEIVLVECPKCHEVIRAAVEPLESEAAMTNIAKWREFDGDTYIRKGRL